MTSVYLKCDFENCGSIFDRHPLGYELWGGPFGKLGGGIREYAATLGWTNTEGKDFCPEHSVKAAP